MIKEVIEKEEIENACLNGYNSKTNEDQLQEKVRKQKLIQKKQSKESKDGQNQNQKYPSRADQIFLCCLIEQKKGLKDLFLFESGLSQKQSSYCTQIIIDEQIGQQVQINAKVKQNEKQIPKDHKVQKKKKDKKEQKLLKFPELDDGIFELYREFRRNLLDREDKISFSQYRRILTIWENLGKDTSEKLVKPNQFLKYKDLARLSPGNWLNDQIISSYLALLKQKMSNGQKTQKQEKTPQLIILDSLQVCTIFSKKDLSEVHKILEKSCTHVSTSNILGVVNFCKHWLFFLIEHPTNIQNSNPLKFTIFDSRPMRNISQYKQIDIILNVLDWARFYYKKKISFSICQNFPRQDNNSDCGVMVLCGITDLTNEFLFWSFNHQQMNFRRALITKQLVNGCIEDL